MIFINFFIASEITIMHKKTEFKKFGFKNIFKINYSATTLKGTLIITDLCSLTSAS